VRRESDTQWGNRRECRVRLWRGYVTAQFYVSETDSGDRAVLCSPLFRTWRPPWRPKADTAVEESPEAVAALETLTLELVRGGWRCNDASATWDAQVFTRAPDEAPVTVTDAACVGEGSLLRALEQAGNGHGATAAELGRALFGDEAAAARQLPLALGNRLRSLQLKGKVARHQEGGVNRWSVASPEHPLPERPQPASVSRLTRLGSLAKRALPSLVVGA
jgi:hypothetical protein